jgi:hypothetical protein
LASAAQLRQGPDGARPGFYLDELKAFVGEAVWQVPCPNCGGKGGKCAGCGGSGKVRPDARPGWLCGVLIDRNLLAQALTCLTAELAWVYGQEGSSILFVMADDRRVALAAILPTASSWQDAPRLG